MYPPSNYHFAFLLYLQGFQIAIKSHLVKQTLSACHRQWASILIWTCTGRSENSLRPPSFLMPLRVYSMLRSSTCSRWCPQTADIVQYLIIAHCPPAGWSGATSFSMWNHVNIQMFVNSLAKRANLSGISLHCSNKAKEHSN